MSPADREQMEIDAGEYVLGTADDLTRQRVERDRGGEFAKPVATWEARLGVLGLALDPVEPPAEVWQGIERALADDRAPPGPAAARSVGQPRLRIWQGVAVAASIAAVVLAALLVAAPGVFRTTHAAAPAYASMVYDQTTGMSWLVTVKPNSHQMHVVAMGNYAVPQGKTLRAWIVPAHGAPLFVGHLPAHAGSYSMHVSDKIARSLDQHAQFVVSMDDRSRSPEDGPSKRIMWHAPVARRTS